MYQSPTVISIRIKIEELEQELAMHIKNTLDWNADHFPFQDDLERERYLRVQIRKKRAELKRVEG